MILNEKDIEMKKLAFVLISFMASLLLATMVIVGGTEVVISSGQITTGNNRLVNAAFSSKASLVQTL